jgi:hypothetical protein
MFGRRTIRIALVLAVLPAAALAQDSEAGDDGLAPLLERSHEIALARSAAPREVSADATVMVLERGTGFVIAKKGTNGVTCVVGRSWALSLEPHCFDPEASRTILPTYLRRMEMKEQGADRAAIDADIAEGLRTGRFQPPGRPAVSWMMSSAQVLYNDEGRHVGAWKPHLMIYYPYLQAEDIGMTGSPYGDGPIVVDAGKPTANLMIVMPSFVDPESAGGT